MNADPDLLEKTLAASTLDGVTVNADGTMIPRLPFGSTISRRPVHADVRGELQEIISPGLAIAEVPVCQVYMVTLRPNVVKGWALHKLHEDRYFVVSGHMQVVLFDPRPDSPTSGMVFSVTMSERDRFVLTIPTHVWHADYNCGAQDAILVNMPTRPYDREAPDKYRLPIDTPLIPYRFPATATGY